MTSKSSFATDNNLPPDDGSGVEALTSDLDLHSALATQVGIIGEHEREIFPDNSLDSSNNISFTIDSSLNYLIKPEEIYLCGTFKIVDGHGDNIPAQIDDPANPGNNIDNPAAKVLPINYTAGSAFKSVTVKLNNTIIAKGNTLQPWKADLGERLFQSASVKKHQNYSRGWMEERKAWENLGANDKTTIFNATGEIPDSALAPLISRWIRSKHSREFSAISPLAVDICQQPKLLPPNAQLVISFSKHDQQNFNVLTDSQSNYKLKIISLYLKVNYKEIDWDILNEIIKVTQGGKMYRYPISRVEMYQFTKSAGTTDLSENNIFKVNSIAPKRFFVVLIDQEAFGGAKNRDPFNYANFDIGSYRLVKGGNDTVGSTVLCNRDNFDFHQPVHYLHNAINILPQAEEDLGINVLNYEHRNFIMGHKLSYTNASPLELSDLPEKTFYSLDIKLRASHARPLAMIIYAEYDAAILVDGYGNVTRSDNALANE